MLFTFFGIENGPENQIIPSCLAELRHSAAAKSDNLNITKTPHLRGFCFPAIRQGYSRDALHQYPCHIVVLQKNQQASALAGAFLFQGRGNHLRRALLINQPDGSDPFKHTQHPVLSEVIWLNVCKIKKALPEFHG